MSLKFRLRQLGSHPFAEKVQAWLRDRHGPSLGVQILIILVFMAMVSVSLETIEDYREKHRDVSEQIARGQARDYDLPSRIPSIVQPIGTLIAGIGFLIAINLGKKRSLVRRSRSTLAALWLVCTGILVAWLPSDYIANHGSIQSAMVGEQPAMVAYYGKLVAVAVLLLSLPAVAGFFYRSSLMDRYVVRSFLTPFTFCLAGFIGIWLIFDLMDNGPDFANSGAGFAVLARFYVMQLPQVILFVLPVTLLLSLLYSLSQMSRSNELISMLGAGRSMMRILRPLFFFGLYASLVALVFKYHWAPHSEAYKAALLDAINSGAFEEEMKAKKKGKKLKERWARHGWMYVNQTDKRTWFVGRVPFDLTKQRMNSIVIWQFDSEGRLLMSHRATSANWFFGTRDWKFNGGKTYFYGEDGVPKIQSWDSLVIPGWRETPWKVLSSSLNPEHMGVPGLTTYLKSNADYDSLRLAPFRTNWWYCWAEPLSCFVMVLVSAPLGIVYSRRGVLGGVAASIVIFAAIYFLRGTFLALGQGGYLHPFLAAWGTNFIFAGIGAGLLYFRSQNREVPSPKELWRRLRTRVAPRAPDPETATAT